MIRIWDNPVARHAGRLAGGSGRAWAIPLLLLAAGLIAGLLQRYWMELGIYNLTQPAAGPRWIGTVLLGETVIALPWAAVRGALLWRRMRREGHLDEYRRTRLSAAGIAIGAIGAALWPVFGMLALSLGLSLGAALTTGAVSAQQVLRVHGLLAVQSMAFAAVGLCLAGWLQYPAAAIPVAVALLALAVTAIAMLNPFYRGMHDPTGPIYWALLPNPVTAAGNVLETDVLRFDWVYQHVRATEYMYVYPPAWQTAALYLGIAGALFGVVARRISTEEP